MKAQIIAVDNFEQLHNHLKDENVEINKTLVICDVDGVIVDAEHALFSVMIIKEHYDLMETLLGHKASNEELDIFCAMLVSLYQQKVIDPKSKGVIEAFSNSGAKCVAMTSLLSGNVSVGSQDLDLVALRLKMLQDFGYNFDGCGVVERKVMDAAPYLGTFPIFKSGVMFSNGERDVNGLAKKGQATVNLLTLISEDVQPKNIVFIDDKIENIQAVQQALAEIDDVEYNFIGMHYNGAKNKHDISDVAQLSSVWQGLLLQIPDIISKRKTAPLENRVANDFDCKIAPDKSKIHFLTTGLYGGVVQCSMAPLQVSETKMHRTVSEMWAFKGSIEIDVFKQDTKNSKPRIVSIKNPTHYYIARINAGESFKFENLQSKAAKFLIATVPTWPGSNEAISVSDFLPSGMVEQQKRQFMSAIIEKEYIGYMPINVVLRYADNSTTLEDGLKSCKLDSIKGATFFQYTIGAKSVSSMRKSDSEEYIVAGIDIDGLQLSRSYDQQHSSLLTFSATADSFASANIPVGVSYQFKNDTEKERNFLFLAMPKM